MTTIEDDAVKKLDNIYQNKANNKPQSNQQQVAAKPQQSAPKQAQPNSQTNEAKQPEVRAKEAVKTAPKKPVQQAQSNQKGGFNNRNKGKNNNNQNRNKNNQNKGKQQPVQPQIKQQKELPAKITYSESLTVAELGKKLHREPSEIIKKLFLLGVMATINQELDKDAIELIAGEYGVEVEEEIKIDTTDLEVYFAEEDEANLVERPSVVTIMGHVDHGKTRRTPPTTSAGSRQAGLVTSRRDGTRITNALAGPHVLDLCLAVCETAPTPEARAGLRR